MRVFHSNRAIESCTSISVVCFTWAVVARYFLSFIVLILSGCLRPGHNAVTVFMALQALMGAVGVLKKKPVNSSLEVLRYTIIYKYRWS